MLILKSNKVVKMIQFGTGGNPQEFYDAGYKKSEQMPEFLAQKGLQAYEYECSRGVRISDGKTQLLNEAAQQYGISLSVHAPYYISLSTTDPEKQQKTIQYITDTMTVAQKMGADRIVVHAGALLGLEREEAVQNACHLLAKAIQVADDMGLGDITICPETMGKINQLGNSQEIIQMCKLDKRLIPTIDFGHLYCRNLGHPFTTEEWMQELQLYIDGLGQERMRHFHAHFSKMEYTQKGGEKAHVTFEEKTCGPDFSMVAKALKKLQLEPRIICESAGTQAIDAVIMQNIYMNLR